MSDKLMKLREILDTTKLPEGIKWYSAGNKRVFEIRGADGLVKTDWIAYLITKVKGQYYKFGISFTQKQSLSTYKQKIAKAILSFQTKVKGATAAPFDADGGSLGFSDE